MVKIRYDFIKLKARLEIFTGNQYTWSVIALNAGVSQNTMSSWVNNKTARADLVGLAKMLNFFQAEGMAIKLEDLFYVEYPIDDFDDKTTI